MRKKLWALAGVTGLVASAAVLVPFAPTVARAAASDIKINEIITDGPGPDSIELINNGAAAVDVSGWIIKDDNDARTDALPANTTIAPGGYLVLSDGTHFDFGLGNGDSARIFLPDGTTVVDEHAFGSHSSPSWSRCPNGTGAFVQANSATLGAANDCAIEQAGPEHLVLNEVDSGPLDWVEFFNTSTQPLDLAGYVMTDNAPNDETHRYTFPVGTTVPAQGYLVVENSPETFTFGLGGADSVHVFAPGETEFTAASAIQTASWTEHAAIDGDEAIAANSRCADGSWVVTYATPGGFNDCPTDIRINEVESNGDATDWVEVVNASDAPVDISGWTISDNGNRGPADVTPLPAGTTLAPGAYFVFDENVHFTFGLGAADLASVRDASGATVAEFSWTDHAAGSYSRCPDMTGPFVDAATTTKGAANNCDGSDPAPTPEPENPITTKEWPGSPEVTVLDRTQMFLEDSSGLDYAETADGPVLWSVDNDAATVFKLLPKGDGTVTKASGWENGKKVVFQTTTGDAGPDAEGITVAGDGFLYLAIERDNNDKGTNLNKVLKVDPNAGGATITAAQEWDLTASLPDVSANTGLEAIEWVADADLTGKLWDTAKNKAYDPADYPGHGTGLFFVALENNGHVYAYALNTDGTFAQVSEIVPYLGGVMALDWDVEEGLLWAVCDNGCEGLATQITLNGTGAPGLTHVERPATMAGDLNNEGFATSSTALCVDGVRPVWWMADGEVPGALRAGTLPCVVPEAPFVDTPFGIEHFDAIVWMKEAGLAKGWPDNTFRPLTPVNRDAMAAFLYRLAGSPSVAGMTEPFSDVAPGQEHYDAIVWAANEGVTTGWPDGTFRPVDPIDRNAMMAFMHRFAGSPSFTPPASSPFSDVAPADMFYTEIMWARHTGITRGWPDGTFRPLDDTNRDATAAFFQRFVQLNGFSYKSEAGR